MRGLTSGCCWTRSAPPTARNRPSPKRRASARGGVLGFFQKEHYRLVVEGEPEDEPELTMQTADPLERRVEEERNAARRKAIRDLLYRGDS